MPGNENKRILNLEIDSRSVKSLAQTEKVLVNNSTFKPIKCLNIEEKLYECEVVGD